MKILKNEGKFEVVRLTEDPINAIARGARVCWQSMDKATYDSDNKLVQALVHKGHGAMLEFADLMVLFSDVCRGFTHEQVRHRLSSPAQESTRYVKPNSLKVVVPPHKDEDEIICRFDMGGSNKEVSVKDWFMMNEQMYRALLEANWRAEDARQVLPIATKSQIMVKANLREWRHIFYMRCDRYAHWEIRRVMIDLLRWCQANIPIIFDDFHTFEIDDAVGEYMTTVMPHTKIKNQIKLWEKANGKKFEME